MFTEGCYNVSFTIRSHLSTAISSVGFVLFVFLAGFSDRGVSVCGSWMPLKLVSQESAHCVSQHFKFYSQQRCSKDNVL